MDFKVIIHKPVCQEKGKKKIIKERKEEISAAEVSGSHFSEGGGRAQCHPPSDRCSLHSQLHLKFVKNQMGLGRDSNCIPRKNVDTLNLIWG